MRLTIPCMFAAMLGLAAQLVQAGGEAQNDPPQIAIGERLFLETRFAQANFARPGKADPSLEYTLTINEPLRGPFAGQTMNCRACHLVDEQLKAPQRTGMRTYADFAHRSPVPAREDKQVFASRNAMQMVNVSIAGKHGQIFHFDGEFNSMEDLVRGTFTGRNLGWLPGEEAEAIKHLARVIREDDGQGELAQEFGGSYRKVLSGDATVPAAFRLPAEYRVDVAKASDQEIFDAVAKLVAAYVNDLEFAKDEAGNYSGSPYDQFLRLNNLPRTPAQDETPEQYSQRLLQAVHKLDKPKFVDKSHGEFAYHPQAFAFGEMELAGMKLFFTRAEGKTRGGNCVSCHAAPHFSDFGFHNSGLTQVNYDAAHGVGSFAKLSIPDLDTRNKQPNKYLPATAQHPKAMEPFRRPVDPDHPGHVDLGMWNIFANPDMPAPQAKLKKIACDLAHQDRPRRLCKDRVLLPYTIATFKTPVLRDLGHSEPYMHTGQFSNLKEAVAVYIQTSALARAGQLRNADVELNHININNDDVDALVAFLQALNEDYD